MKYNRSQINCETNYFAIGFSSPVATSGYTRVTSYLHDNFS